MGHCEQTTLLGIEEDFEEEVNRRWENALRRDIFDKRGLSICIMTSLTVFFALFFLIFLAGSIAQTPPSPLHDHFKGNLRKQASDWEKSATVVTNHDPEGMIISKSED